MKLFRQYAGLRREMYVLFWGRVVTNMGALVFPMLTLILKNKMGYSAGEVAGTLLLVGIVQLPCTLLGGKLADRFNKRNLIIVCDLVTVGCYLVCAFLPLSPGCVGLLCMGAVFAHMEGPSYDALVADLTRSADRERAYSLNYLGANVGAVLAPMLGGFLFEHYLGLAFLISGLATFSSTILIIFLVRNIRPEQDDTPLSHYENSRQGVSLAQVLRKTPLVLFFTACTAFTFMLYYLEFQFLLPLNMEQLYGGRGALVYGALASLNAFVVIVGTPLCTGLFAKLRDTSKMLLGQILQVTGFAAFIFIQGSRALYYPAILVFTLGEVFMTLGRQPYLTRRVPASHRGRVASLNSVCTMLLQGVALYNVGPLVDSAPVVGLWVALSAAGTLAAVSLALLRLFDRRHFPLLYRAFSR